MPAAALLDDDRGGADGDGRGGHLAGLLARQPCDAGLDERARDRRGPAGRVERALRLGLGLTADGEDGHAFTLPDGWARKRRCCARIRYEAAGTTVRSHAAVWPMPSRT